MAEVLKANCRICSYETSFKYGGGRFDYQTNNPVPVYDKTTDELKSVNHKLEKDNPDYIFYTEDNLKGNNEGKYIFENFDLKLNQVNNFCPKCKNFTLDFRSYMFYDCPINESQETYIEQGYIKYTKDCYVDDKPKDPIIEYFEDNLKRLLETHLHVSISFHIVT